MPTVLITGANRGIGLQYARTYGRDGWRVHACCRHPDKAKALREDCGGEVVLHRLDVTDGLRVQGLAREMSDEPIDLLINNAGVMGPREGFGHTDYHAWMDALQANALAPMRIAEAFVGSMRASKRKVIVNMSSRMGSIGGNQKSNATIYRTSKAALNMVTKCQANALGPEGFTVICFHPGWVQTEMGGPDAEITVEQSVAGMRNVIAKLDASDNGKFFNYDGEELPW